MHACCRTFFKLGWGLVVCGCIGGVVQWWPIIAPGVPLWMGAWWLPMPLWLCWCAWLMGMLSPCDDCAMGVGGLPDICPWGRGWGCGCWVGHGCPLAWLVCAASCAWESTGYPSKALAFLKASMYLAIVGLITLDCGFKTKHLFYIFNKLAHTVRYLMMTYLTTSLDYEYILSDLQVLVKLNPIFWPHSKCHMHFDAMHNS